MASITDFLNYANIAQTSTSVRKSPAKPAVRRQPLSVAAPVLVPVKNTLASCIVPQVVAVARPISEQDAAPVVPAAVRPEIEMVLAYSDKSFAIFGDTRPLQSQLENLGGTFNRFLKRDGIATPGYIFSNKRLDTVRKTLNI